MNRPMSTMRLPGRPIELSALGVDRGAMLLQRSFGTPSGASDFPAERGSERADRLVPPETAAHYLRQGERIADAIMAVHGLARRLMARFRRAGDGGAPVARIR